MKRKTIKADPFSVWGPPPQSLLNRLSKRDQNMMRRYIEKTVKKVYRLAYDLGEINGREGARRR